MKTLLNLIYLVALSIIIPMVSPGIANASTFNAGRIIDDVVMTNNSSMNITQIQAFLNSKVPVCDTWGTQSYGGTTRAQYAASRGVSTPFTCLKDYTENGKSAAQIIYDVSQKYSINPQVMIVLLQKEQALVTDDWPWPIQYRSATGYGCPDTAPCDSQYYGLTNQLDWAAKMFRAILNNSPTWYTPYVLGNNYIQYSPDANCGGSNVYIQNRSTQALYNYTPYQPNQATLNAGWGTAPCGAYGNRNFHLYFTEWFGITSYNGRAIRGSAPGSGVFLVENGTRRPFESVDAMYAHGYTWGNVILVSDSLLSSMPVGPSINVISAYNLKPIKSNTTGSGVYLVENGTRRPFESVDALFSHGYNWEKVVTVSSSTFNSIPIGSTLGINFAAWQNRAIKSSLPGSGVFLIENNIKRPFASIEALYTNGFSWENIRTVSNFSFNSISEGAPVNVSLAYYNRKPIRSSATGSGVFLIENSIKRPFVSAEALYSHGYNWEKVVIVPEQIANSFPTGSPVTVIR